MSFKNIPEVTADLTFLDITTALGYIPVNKTGDVMTGSLILNSDPSVPLEAATKQYVDSVAQGLNVKSPCRVATTSNLASLSGLLTIDGIVLSSGNRVLVKDQTSGAQNGIYVASVGAWSRSSDFNTGSEAESAFTFIQEGTVNSSTGWVQTTPAPITLGVTSLSFYQFSGTGAYTTDGQGIELVGTQFRLELDGTTLSKSSSGLKIASGGITNTEVNASAAIAYSKLNLSNSIVNADINASAAIAYSKLNLSNFIVNADINASAAIAYSKLNLSNSIVNADINASAAIGRNKLALGSANHVLINDGSGVMSSEAVLAISRGGTGSSTQNFVDLSTNQSVSGTKTFNNQVLTQNGLQLKEQSAPSTPASTLSNIYLESSNGFGRLRYQDSTGEINTILRDTIFIVKNITGSTITKGQVVYANGADSSSNTLTVALAKADSSSTVPALGLMLDTVTNNNFGRVISIGNINNIDTSSFTLGQRLYLSPTVAGGLTSTKPTSPNIWQRIGIVLKVGVSDGIIEVRPLATHGEESGTNTSFTLNTITLTDAANIATNASLGNRFTVTLGANRNLSAPTNPINGQKCIWEFKQDATGGRTLSFDSIFNFGSLPTLILSGSPNGIDYMGAIYNSVQNKWNVVAYSTGF